MWIFQECLTYVLIVLFGFSVFAFLVRILSSFFKK